MRLGREVDAAEEGREPLPTRGPLRLPAAGALAAAADATSPQLAGRAARAPCAKSNLFQVLSRAVLLAPRLSPAPAPRPDPMRRLPVLTSAVFT